MSGTGRTVIALGLVAAMLVALVVVLLSGSGDDDPVATAPSTTSTTTPTTTSTPTTVALSTTTTTLDPDARLAEVEQILEDLELARLVAIYEKDESALTQIIAIRSGVDQAIEAFDTLSFVANPAQVGIKVQVLAVLLDRPDCLVVHHEFDGTETLGAGATETAVRILWPRTTGGADYRLAGLWSSPGDLWQDDCDLMDRDEVP